MTRDSQRLLNEIDSASANASALNPYIGAVPPPPEASIAEGLRHYGGEPCSAFACWLAWRGIHRVANEAAAFRGPAPSARADEIAAAGGQLALAGQKAESAE